MPSLRSSPRTPSTFAIPLLALPLSCTGGEDGEGEEVADETTGGETTGDGDGDGGPCTEPGTTVPGIEPFQPADDDPLPTCAEGWASDAPLADPSWAVALEPAELPGYYYSYNVPPVVRALPGKQAVVAQGLELQWFDGSGERTATLEHGLDINFSGLSRDVIVARDDGHVFAAGRENGDIVIREFLDGEIVGDIAVPTPGETNSVVALQEFSPDEWLLVGNEFDPNEGSEMFFMRVDAQGQTIMRKATSGGYCYYCYAYASIGTLDAAANLLFGSPNALFVVDADTGMVLNNTTLPGLRSVAGSPTGAGFAWVSSTFLNSSDATITAINGVAVQQWTQTYERISSGNDGFVTVDAMPEGGYVAGGSEAIWWEPGQFVTRSQPIVIAVDEQGAALWKGRLAIPGDVRSVDVASDGSVAATGLARTGGVDYANTDDWLWVAVW
jgi:hypothetical protein